MRSERKEERRVRSVAPTYDCELGLVALCYVEFCFRLVFIEGEREQMERVVCLRERTTRQTSRRESRLFPFRKRWDQHLAGLGGKVKGNLYGLSTRRTVATYKSLENFMPIILIL